MAGNRLILDLTVVPDPVGSNCYVIKNNTDYRVSLGGAGGIATLGSDGKLLAAQVPAQSITVTFASLSGKPTTISGYGITDAVTTSGNQSIAGTKTFSSTIGGNISGNAASATSVAWTGVTGKPTTFAPAAHNHTASDITSGVLATARLGTGTATASTVLKGSGAWGSVAYSELTGVPSTFAPAAHSAALLTSGTIPSARLDGTYTDLIGVSGTGGSTFLLYRASSGGSAASPSYSWSGDTNTGIYNPSADALTITTGGVARLTANTTGIVVAGSITATGNITGYSSDKRLKTDVKNITYPMDKLFRIGGYTFKWDLPKCSEVGFLPDNLIEHGVIAQEVQKIIPDAVSKAAFDPEYLTVNYARLVPLLIECIKELNNRLDRLEAQSE